MTNVELATLNVLLVGVSTVFIVAGFAAIRRQRIDLHRRCMLVAFALQALFTASFVARYVRYGPTPFEGAAVAKIIYNVVLVVHEPIAVVSVPLVVATLVLGLGRRFRAHRQMAGLAWAIWLFSSVSGVAIYFFLYV